MKRNTPLRRKTPLKRVSKTRQKALNTYSKLRQSFLQELPLCEVCPTVKMDQRNQSTDVHHKKGRGKHYLDVDSWLSVCRQCHDRIHVNPSWAREKGYLLEPDRK
jgi:hypothetical protein